MKLKFKSLWKDEKKRNIPRTHGVDIFSFQNMPFWLNRRAYNRCLNCGGLCYYITNVKEDRGLRLIEQISKNKFCFVILTHTFLHIQVKVSTRHSKLRKVKGIQAATSTALAAPTTLATKSRKRQTEIIRLNCRNKKENSKLNIKAEEFTNQKRQKAHSKLHNHANRYCNKKAGCIEVKNHIEKKGEKNVQWINAKIDENFFQTLNMPNKNKTKSTFNGTENISSPSTKTLRTPPSIEKKLPKRSKQEETRNLMEIDEDELLADSEGDMGASGGLATNIVIVSEENDNYEMINNGARNLNISGERGTPTQSEIDLERGEGLPENRMNDVIEEYQEKFIKSPMAGSGADQKYIQEIENLRAQLAEAEERQLKANKLNGGDDGLLNQEPQNARYSGTIPKRRANEMQNKVWPLREELTYGNMSENRERRHLQPEENDSVSSLNEDDGIIGVILSKYYPEETIDDKNYKGIEETLNTVAEKGKFRPDISGIQLKQGAVIVELGGKKSFDWLKTTVTTMLKLKCKKLGEVELKPAFLSWLPDSKATLKDIQQELAKFGCDTSSWKLLKLFEPDRNAKVNGRKILFLGDVTLQEMVKQKEKRFQFKCCKTKARIHQLAPAGENRKAIKRDIGKVNNSMIREQIELITFYFKVTSMMMKISKEPEDYKGHCKSLMWFYEEENKRAAPAKKLIEETTEQKKSSDLICNTLNFIKKNEFKNKRASQQSDYQEDKMNLCQNVENLNKIEVVNEYFEIKDEISKQLRQVMFYFGDDAICQNRMKLLYARFRQSIYFHKLNAFDAKAPSYGSAIMNEAEEFIEND